MNIPKVFTTVTPLSKIIAMALFVSLPFVGFYIGKKYSPDVIVNCNNTVPNKCPTLQPEKTLPGQSWSKPVSTDSVIPIVKDDTLYTYSLTQKKLQSTEYKSSWGSGAAGAGQDNPQSSPDNKMIAFINRGDDRHLYLLAGGSQKAVKITSYPVQYITDWSSDSSKILFYVGEEDVNNRKVTEMGGNLDWNKSESFSKGSAPGLHSFDIANGVDTYLYPLPSSEGFIDTNRILVEAISPDDSKLKKLILFNIDTFVADYSTVSHSIKSFSNQMSFSRNASVWARTVDDGGTNNGVKIVFAKFPQEDGDVVDTGAWAFIQKPLISGDGKYLAYTKRGDQIKDGKFAGQYTDKTIIWDTSTKKVIAELPGWPQYWTANNAILIGRTDYGTNPAGFNSFDLYYPDTKTTDSFQVK